MPESVATARPDPEPTTAQPTDTPSADPELTAEREHLASSRAALAQMREHTASLEATGGDHVSLQYVKQMLHRRMQALTDDPTVPLFFGRLDYTRAQGHETDERFHIGRRHVAGEAGAEPMVIDWRAPMSLPFYQAKPTEPMGVAMRRRFGFEHGRLTAFEDEDLRPGHDQAGSGDILQAEIERPRTGPMRDIVATIQPDQDVIVRTDLATSVCVQGAPGTGKTAVGLHRAAYLLYAHREQLSRSGVLVVGPNDNFLAYIGDVLPALGEIDATSETISSLVTAATGQAVRGLEPAAPAALKGDARMAEVLRRAVWRNVQQAPGPLVVPRGHRQWRVPTYLIDEISAEVSTRGVRYEAGRQMIGQRLAHQVLLKLEAAGDSPDDRVQNAVARSAPVRDLVKTIWPKLDAAKLVLALLTDADLLAEVADGLLDADEQRLLIMAKPARSVASARWTLADVVLIDEARDLLERTPSLGHVIIDEAQDLSAMQLRAIGRRATTGSVTVLGDLAQATTPWASSSWADSLWHLGHETAEVTELVEGFRVPGAVIDYAARLLPTIAPTLAPPYSIRRARGELTFTPGGEQELLAAVTRAAGFEGTIGVIVPDARVAGVHDVLARAGLAHRTLGGEPLQPGEQPFDVHVDLVPATLAKGLEFDHVVLAEPAEIVTGEPDRTTGLRRLYVCLTRAVTSLVVVHDAPLPAELAA